MSGWILENTVHKIFRKSKKMNKEVQKTRKKGELSEGN